MQFFWDEINEAEIEAHGIDRATAEAVLFAEDRGISKDPSKHNRFLAEGTVDGELYRIPFSNVFPNGTVSPQPSVFLGEGGEHDQAQVCCKRNDLGGILY